VIATEDRRIIFSFFIILYSKTPDLSIPARLSTKQVSTSSGPIRESKSSHTVTEEFTGIRTFVSSQSLSRHRPSRRSPLSFGLGDPIRDPQPTANASRPRHYEDPASYFRPITYGLPCHLPQRPPFWHSARPACLSGRCRQSVFTIPMWSSHPRGANVASGPSR